jgi:pimeloyl-ACP methyl ester carboxylesterase
VIPAVVAVVGLTILVGPAVWFIRKLALRVVGVTPRRKVIDARRVGETIELPQSTLTTAPGNYGLWFGQNFQHHALVGAVEHSDEQRVVRRLVNATTAVPTETFKAQWTGHIMHSPSQIDENWEDTAIPLRDGTTAPAWLFRATDPGAPWVIHVQGIRTSRLVTLRSVEVAERAGLTSLVVTYRGAGDGPVARVSYLGQREWSDLADAIAYARLHGAPEVFVVAWSMGAGVALELLRREPDAFERLVLVAPATNWSQIVRQGIERAGLPRLVGSIVTWALRSPIGSRILGMPAPLDFRRLDWSRGYKLSVPTLVLHSPGDDEIPFRLTKEFAATHPSVTLVETASAPHGWEANVDPEPFQSALTSFLSTP